MLTMPASSPPRRISETLPEEILAKMHAPAKPNYPILAPGDLANFDAFLFGVPTRYGNFPAQWKNFWDATGQLWASGGLYGKYVSVFVSTASPGGGQESTVIATLSTFTHHGMIFVPFGYAKAFGQLTNLSEVHGGEPPFPSVKPSPLLSSVLHPRAISPVSAGAYACRRYRLHGAIWGDCYLRPLNHLCTMY